MPAVFNQYNDSLWSRDRRKHGIASAVMASDCLVRDIEAALAAHDAGDIRGTTEVLRRAEVDAGGGVSPSLHHAIEA